MKKGYCLPLAAFFVIFAMAPLASAHGGQKHAHHEEMHHEAPTASAPAQPQAGQMQDSTATLMLENSSLRKENEKLKSEAGMEAAGREAPKAKMRTTFVIGGIVFLMAGIFIRYAPGKTGDEN